MTNFASPVLSSAIVAFQNVPERGIRRVFGSIPNLHDYGHVQGVARYGPYWICTHSREQRATGTMHVFDDRTRQWVHEAEVPAEGKRSHPGGMQLCGDLLFVAVERYVAAGDRGPEKGDVFMYDLSKMDGGVLPAPSAVHPFSGSYAGAAGAVSLAEGGHLIVAYDNGQLTFWRSRDADPTTAALTKLTYDGSSSDIGAEGVGLLRDEIGLWLVTLEARAHGNEDWARLWRVRLRGETVEALGEPVLERHLVTKHGAVKGLPGVHFPFGAGVRVTSPTSIELFATQQFMLGGSSFTMNVFGADGQPTQVNGDGTGSSDRTRGVGRGPFETVR